MFNWSVAHTVFWLAAVMSRKWWQTELSPMKSRCLICKNRHSNGLWVNYSKTTHMQNSYFNLFKLLQFFWASSSTSLSSSPLTNYAMSSYTIAPKHHFRQHAHTHWLLLSCTAPHLNLLCRTLHFIKPCLLLCLFVISASVPSTLSPLISFLILHTKTQILTLV